MAGIAGLSSAGSISSVLRGQGLVRRAASLPSKTRLVEARERPEERGRHDRAGSRAG